MRAYLKTLSELQKIGDEILDKCNKDNPYYEVDIDGLVEKCYDIRIEGAPLKWEHGVEGYPFGLKGLVDLKCYARSSALEKPLIEVRLNVPVKLKIHWAGGEG